MVILGLILVAAAVVAIVEGILANTGVVTVHMWGWTWHFELFWAMVCGIGIAVAALLGLWLITAGTTRGYRVRRDRRMLARENERLAAAASERAAAHQAAERDAAASVAANAAARRAAENRAAEKPPVVPVAPTATAATAPPVAPVAGAHAVHEPGYVEPGMRQDGVADGSFDGQREHQSMLGRVLHRH